jgi:uncharacterized protein YukE
MSDNVESMPYGLVAQASEDLTKAGRQLLDLLENLDRESAGAIATWTSEEKDRYLARRMKWQESAEQMSHLLDVSGGFLQGHHDLMRTGEAVNADAW